MPLKLIERVLPWLMGSLTEDETKDFLKNIQLAGVLSILYMAFWKISAIQYNALCILFLTMYSSLIQLLPEILLW